MTTLIDSLRSALTRARATRATRTLSPYWAAVEALASGNDIEVDDQKLLDAMLAAEKTEDDLEADAQLLGELRQAEAQAATAADLEKQAPAVGKEVAKMRARSEELLAESKKLYEAANRKARANQEARMAAAKAAILAKNLKAQLAARGHAPFAAETHEAHSAVTRDSQKHEISCRIAELESQIVEIDTRLAAPLELPLGRESRDQLEHSRDMYQRRLRAEQTALEKLGAS